LDAQPAEPCFLAYCNAHADLQTSYCSGSACTTTLQATSCKGHWQSFYGPSGSAGGRFHQAGEYALELCLGFNGSQPFSFAMTGAESMDPGKYAEVTLASDTPVHSIVVTGIPVTAPQATATGLSGIQTRQSTLTVELRQANGTVLETFTADTSSVFAVGLYSTVSVTMTTDTIARGCAETDQFLQDVGSLAVVGPAQAQTFTCVAGRACEIDGLRGRDLRDTDAVVVLETCGAPAAPAFPGGGPNRDARIPGISFDFPVSPQASFANVSASGSSLAWTVVTVPGGEYRLCWCSGLASRCASVDDYTVDAAELHIIGPWDVDRTCVAGRTCSFDGIPGYLLAEGDQYLVLETCGTAPTGTFAFTSGYLINPDLETTVSRGTRWHEEKKFSLPPVRGDPAGVGAAVVSTNSGQSVVWAGWGAAVPGQYRLCWCRGACPTSGDFRADAGRLTNVGPHARDFTCISGHRCTLPGVTGIGLATADRIAILDTCGSDGVRDEQRKPFGRYAYERGGRLRRDFGQMTFDAWGTWHVDWEKVLTAPGGTYRLCWCPAGHAICEAGEDFLADVGSLTLEGPVQTDHTCVSGEACRIEGLYGQGLAVADSFVIVDTCGAASAAHGFPDYGIANRSRSTMWWSEVTAAGGTYRLCWCSQYADCSLHQNHTVDAGQVFVVGYAVRDGQSRTCVAGLTCEVRGLVGEELGGGTFLVLDTCGDYSLAPGFPAAGHASATRSGASVAFSTTVTAAGGVYQLCWCAPDFDCHDPRSFSFAAWLTLIGPSPLTQDRTCVAGRHCMLDAPRGQLLSPTDRYMVLETCGTQSVAAGWPNAGLSADHAAYDENVLVSFGTVPDTAANGEAVTGRGGEYRLCWCWGGGRATYTVSYNSLVIGFQTYRNCVRPEEFAIDAGALYVLGASEFIERTCVSGQVCEFGGIHGLGLSTTDRVMLLDTCGAPGAAVIEGASWQASVPHAGLWAAPTTADVSFGSTPFTATGGVYRLCWCSTVAGQCSVSQDFVQDFGELAILAPYSWHGAAAAGGADAVRRRRDFGSLTHALHTANSRRTCVSGQTCHVRALDGLGISPVDHYLVLETCGTSAEPWGTPGRNVIPNATDGLNIPNETDVFNSTHGHPGLDIYWGAAGTFSAVGGVYRLCWCASGFACSEASDFRVDAGDFVVVGPAWQSAGATCVSGQTCQVDGIVGTGLQTTDRYMVLETCGTSAYVIGFPNWARSDAVAESGAAIRWGAQVLTGEGGVYRLCWCAGGFTCTKEEHFLTEIAAMTVVGPDSHTQDRTCVAGRRCVVGDITGHHLSGDRVHWIHGLRLAQDGGYFYDAKYVEVMHSDSWNGPWVSLPLLAPKIGVTGWQEFPFGEWHSDPYWRVIIHETPTGNPPRLRELGFQGPFGYARTFIDPAWVLYSSGSGTTAGLFDGSLGASTQWRPGGLPRFYNAWRIDFDFSTGDKVLLLDTCGASAMVPRMSSAGFASSVTASGASFVWGGLPSTQARWNATPSGEMLPTNLAATMKQELPEAHVCVTDPGRCLHNSTGAPLTAAGGRYKLCWCSRGFACSLPEHFPVVVGDLTLVGPRPVDQRRTCVAGKTCEIHSFTGVGLTGTDSVMILDTCGGDRGAHTALEMRKRRAHHVVPGFPESGMASAALSGAVFYWGAEPITAPGGQYRLCWCAGGLRCSVEEEFNLDAGELVLVGPSPLAHDAAGQDRTCVGGQTCLITAIRGMHLSDDDSYIILDTCGASTRAPGSWQTSIRTATAGRVWPYGVPRPTNENAGAARTSYWAADFWAQQVVPMPENGFAGTVARSGAVAVWFPPITAPAGSYRLCWCGGDFVDHALQNGTSASCGTVLDFSVDVGELRILGAPTGLTRTCVAGQTCALDGLKTSTSAYDVYILLDTCGVNAAIERAPARHSVPETFAAHGPLPPIGLAELVAAVDSDGDGRISVTEAAALLAAVDTDGSPATLSVADVSGTNHSALVAIGDTNGDGAVSSAEATRVIAFADADDDGAVDSYEFAALAPLTFTGSAAVVAAADSDSDGIVTRSEARDFLAAADTDGRRRHKTTWHASVPTEAAVLSPVDVITTSAASIVSFADRDGDGSVSLREAEEFVPSRIGTATLSSHRLIYPRWREPRCSSLQLTRMETASSISLKRWRFSRLLTSTAIRRRSSALTSRGTTYFLLSWLSRMWTMSAQVEASARLVTVKRRR
jgi:hypothetical protein